jgi:hypothetical protein
MEITVKMQHNDDMRSITLISPTGDTLRIFSEEAIDFFHGVEQSHKHGVSGKRPSDDYTEGYRKGWSDCCKDVAEHG